MASQISIADLRTELGDTLQQFGLRIGIASKGNVSVFERENRCPLAPALRLEELSGGRIDAADLNDDVRAARAACRHACADSPAPAPASPDTGAETIGPETIGNAQRGEAA